MSDGAAWVICMYGKRFLRLTRPDPSATSVSGWRSLTWTPWRWDAEKWASAEAAAGFARANLRGEYVIRPY